MMSKLNPWQALAALAIISGCTVALIVTGHKADIGTFATGAGAVVLALLNVLKPSDAAIAKAISVRPPPGDAS